MQRLIVWLKIVVVTFMIVSNSTTSMSQENAIDISEALSTMTSNMDVMIDNMEKMANKLEKLTNRVSDIEENQRQSNYSLPALIDTDWRQLWKLSAPEGQTPNTIMICWPPATFAERGVKGPLEMDCSTWDPTAPSNQDRPFSQIYKELGVYSPESTEGFSIQLFPNRWFTPELK